MHKMVARAITGRNRWTAPLPAWYAKFLTAVVPGSLLPFNRDQVTMSQENNTAELGHFIHDFGWTPRGFDSALQEYAARL
jgi:hypothetical protein